MSSSKLSEPNRVLQTPLGTITPHILLLIIQIIALSSPKFPGRQTIFAISLFATATVAHFNGPFTQDLPSAQPWSLMWPHYFSVIEKLILSGAAGPEFKFWRLDRAPYEASKFRAFSFDKINWALAMIINLRGIGWNYQVKNVSIQPNRSKKDFLIKQFVDSLCMLFMTDLLLQLGTHTFFTAKNGQIGEVNSKFISLRDGSLAWSFFRTLVFGCGPYFFINLQYTIISMIAVSLGLSEPKDWPPFFGKLKDVTTVREFWGKFWHQSLRRFLTEISGAFVDILHIKRGRNISSYTQLWLGFGTSGFMHAASMMILPAPINITFLERTLGMLQFFFWQALVITLEDFVQWVFEGRLNSAKSKMLRTCVGYLWVTCSMWYSLPFAGDVMLRLRLIEKPFLPFTFMGPWIKEYVPITST